jgi:hypothetical protein
MNAVTFDSLKAVKSLEAAGVQRNQAEAMVSLISEASTMPDQSALATKTDLSDLKFDILKWTFGAIGFQTLVVVAAVVALAKFSH